MSRTEVREKKVVSCRECRRLKIKCELVFPCRHCVKRGLSDICPDGQLTNGSRRVKILASTKDLHDRIASLEQALLTLAPKDHPLIQDAIYANRQEVQWASEERQNDRQSRKELPTSNDRTTISPDGVERPSRYSHLVLGETAHTTRYFGPSSIAYLTAGLNRIGPTRDLNLIEPFSVSASPDILQSLAELLVQLPPEAEGRRLADIYFQTFGWWTSIIPIESWETKFFTPVYTQQIVTQNLAAVFLVFALATLMDITSLPQPPAAQLYFEAARRCLVLDSSHTVTYVQCIYLYCSYLMSGQKDISAVDTVRPMLRMGEGICESLGLHRDGNNWNLPEDVANERRSVFWAIHARGVRQSSVLGRMQSFSDQMIDCAIPIEKDAFHGKSYELMRILGRINERQSRVTQSSYAEIVELDSSLKRFEENLPAELSPAARPSPLDLTDPTRQKQASQRTMLLLFTSETRLALHKTWFLRILDSNPTEPLHSAQRDSYLNCLEASRNAISLVKMSFALQGQLLNRTFHHYFHLFSACVCLATAVIRSPGSLLARSVLFELDKGVELFRMTGREELHTVERLRQHASEAIENNQAQSHSPITPIQSSSPAINDYIVPILPDYSDIQLPNIFPGVTQTIDFSADFDMDSFLADIGII